MKSRLLNMLGFKETKWYPLEYTNWTYEDSFTHSTITFLDLEVPIRQKIVKYNFKMTEDSFNKIRQMCEEKL